MGRQVFKWAILFCILYLCSGEEITDVEEVPETTTVSLTEKLVETADKLEKNIERVEKIEQDLLAVANATSSAPVESEEGKPAAGDDSPIHVVIDGKKIKEFVDCEDSPCENGGTCEETAEGGTCKCKDEFTGPTCSETGKEAPSVGGFPMLYLIVAASLGIILITSASIFIIFIIQVRNERARLQKEYTDFLKRNKDLPQMTWKRLAKSVLKNRLNILTCGAICCPSRVQDHTRAEIEELIRLEEEEKRQLELELQCGMSQYSARLHHDATEDRRMSAAKTASAGIAGSAASVRASSHRSAASKKSHQNAKTGSGMSRVTTRTTSRMSRGSLSNPAYSESADDFDNPEDTPLLSESD